MTEQELADRLIVTARETIKALHLADTTDALTVLWESSAWLLVWAAQRHYSKLSQQVGRALANCVACDPPGCDLMQGARLFFEKARQVTTSDFE